MKLNKRNKTWKITSKNSINIWCVFCDVQQEYICFKVCNLNRCKGLWTKKHWWGLGWVLDTYLQTLCKKIFFLRCSKYKMMYTSSVYRRAWNFLWNLVNIHFIQTCYFIIWQSLWIILHVSCTLSDVCVWNIARIIIYLQLINEWQD